MAVALLALLLLVTKVLSPQYIIWLVGPALVLASAGTLRALRHSTLVWSLSGVAVLTFLEYPVFFVGLINNHLYATTPLLLRNLALGRGHRRAGQRCLLLVRAAPKGAPDGAADPGDAH